jgi:hypothetical protein
VESTWDPAWQQIRFNLVAVEEVGMDEQVVVD